MKLKAQTKEKKKNPIVSLFEGSAIFSFLDKLAAIIYERLGSGVFGGIFTAYEREDGRLKEGGIASAFPGAPSSKSIKSRIARGCENSVILSGIKNLLGYLSRVSLRCYSVFFLLYGFIAMAGTVYGAWKLDFAEFDTLTAIIAGAHIAVGIALVFSGESLARGLCQNRALSFLLFDVMGVRKGALDPDAKPVGKIGAALFLGGAFGIATQFVPSLYITAAAVGLLGLYTVLVIPEFGLLCTLFALPFLPTMVLVAMVAYVFICYLLKLWRGKRTFRMSLLDVSVCFFFVFMAAGGLFSVGGGGSIKPTLVYLCFMLVYFLFVNLVRSQAWVKRCVIAALSSATLVSFYGIYQNFFGAADTTWQDTDMFSDITGRVVSTFENPNVLGEYLIMVIPLAFALAVIAKKPAGKIGGFLLVCAMCACLVFTWSRGAWLGIILAMFIFFLIYSRKTLIVCLLGLFALPFAPFVLPASIINRITSIGNVADTSTSYRVSIWEASVKLLRDNLFAGIGVGNAAFSKVYPAYSLSGIETAPHSHNLFLQTAIEIGIPGLIVLLAVFFIFAQSSLSFSSGMRRYSEHKKALPALALFAGTVGVLFQGMTDYIWYNYRVYLMFWCVVGLCAAMQRVTGEKELPKQNKKSENEAENNE